MGEANPDTESHTTPLPGVLLLVDDEENILSALRRLLRRDGHQIHTATSGAQGLEVLARENVDVIVSDQRMPGMTGTEFLRHARQLRPDTVRIVLSGYTELESVTSAINEGSVYKFLTKPWDDQQLRDNIAEAVHRKHIDDENARLHRELADANTRLEALLADRQRQLLVGQASLNFAQETMASLPLAIIGVDTDGMIAMANDAAQALFPQAEVGALLDQTTPAAVHGAVRGPNGQATAITHGGRSLLLLSRVIGEATRPRGHVLAFFDATHLEAAHEH